MCEADVANTDRSEIQATITKPRRKWRRRFVWFLVIGPLALIASVLIIGQTPAMKYIVEPILEAQLGVDVNTGTVHLLPTGEIEIRNAVCRSSAIDNRAGSLIEIDRAVISVNWWGVVRGTGQVRSIMIDKPIVRVSQDVETGVLNLAALTLKQGSGGGATPAIEIRDGILEIGEHDKDAYHLLKELSIEGQITEQTNSGVSGFEFEALPTEPSVSDSLTTLKGSFAMTGQISSDGIDGVLDGVRLEDWPPEIVPSRSRGLYSRLDLTGKLAPTRFHVTNDGLVEVVLTLEGVALNLPIEEFDASSAGEGGTLRMRRTRGVIRFGTLGFSGDLRGEIDELGYTVDLDYRGLDADSPFDAMLVTDFRLDSGFKPAKFLPEKVISKLDRFENPQADVHAVVHVSRGDDPSDNAIKVSGKADLSNGSAIYKKFRYPFHDLDGVIEFDPDKLVVREITGVGPTGATLVANGVFSPLGERSVVNLNLKVDGVSIDKHLMEALDKDKRFLVGTLFNEEKYANLIENELVLTKEDFDFLAQRRRGVWDQLDGLKNTGPEHERTPEERALAQELASIDRQLEAPVFDMGGVVNVVVDLVRHPERKSDERWTTDVLVKLPNAGLVPKHFPMPIIAKDVAISITKERVELTGGRYTGLAGGSASVDVAMDLVTPGAKPIIEITARAFPIDDRLIAAIPGYDDPQSEDPDDISLRRILDRLHLGGVMECDATIGPRSNGRLGYDIDATILSGTAHPQRLEMDEGAKRTHEDAASHTGLAGGNPLSLDDLYGTVYITEELIVVDLDGVLSSPLQPLAPTPIQVLTQLTLPRSDVVLADDYGPPVPGARLYATARGDGIDLAMPLEHAIAVISPRIARDLLAKKAIYHPDGVIGMNAKLEGFVGGSIETTLALNQIEHLGFDFDDTHYRIGSSWGQARLVLSSVPRVSFDGFRISITADDTNAGELSLDGQFPLARTGRIIEITEPSTLAIDYKDGTFESPITRGVISQFSGSSSGGWISDHEIGGRFDLGVSISPKLGVHTIAGADDSITIVPTMIHGTLKPTSLTLKMGEKTARFDEVAGEIKFNGFEGIFDQIQASGESTTIGIDGRWSMNPGEGLGVDLKIDAEGDLLSGPVRAILPDAIDTVIDRLEIRSVGTVAIEDLRVHASGLSKPWSSFRIEGGAELVDASALIGLPITGLVGEMGFVVEGNAGELGYQIDIDAARLRAGLMRVYDAQISIIGDAHNPGVILIPEIRAGMHGGQIAGSAQIRPGVGGEPNYWIEMHASGVRAAPVFDDLLLPPEGLVGPPRPGNMSVLSAWSQGQDLSRGALIGDIVLTGPVGNPSKRSGRGLVRIAGGTVLEMPGLINLVEASNLSLPAGSPLDFAEAEFYIDGPTLAFERLSASSKRVEILGYGTMDWESRGVDLRFRSRSLTPIPIVSGLIEKLRDELITTRVSGTMGDPTYSAQQFSATKRLVNAMLGKPLTDHQRRLREVEKQVRASNFRTQRASDDIVHLPSDESHPSWIWDENGDSGE
jgi:hypothetical protein